MSLWHRQAVNTQALLLPQRVPFLAAAVAEDPRAQTGWGKKETKD